MHAKEEIGRTSLNLLFHLGTIITATIKTTKIDTAEANG
jgi:hypothetical protein